MNDRCPDNQPGAIRSRYQDDPVMRSIVIRFAESLAVRSRDLDQALTDSDLERLSSMAHQLKGTAGGYGFDSIGHAAADLERETLSMESDLSSIRERVEDLITLCRAATVR